MLALIEAFFQIVMRRRGPEDLPDSQFLLALAIASYLATQALVAIALYGWTGDALQAVTIEFALLSGCYWLLLKLARKPARYRQTLTALAGTGAILTLPQAPLVLLAGIDSSIENAPAGPRIALLILLVWSIVVQAHITSRALSTNFYVGLAVALGYLLITLQVADHFGPAAR
jgi:hypothetical protein